MHALRTSSCWEGHTQRRLRNRWTHAPSANTCSHRFHPSRILSISNQSLASRVYSYRFTGVADHTHVLIVPAADSCTVR